MKWKTRLFVAALAFTLAVPPHSAVAQTDGDAPAAAAVDKEKLWDYVACAASIAFAAGTQGWILAGITCFRAFHEHFSD